MTQQEYDQLLIKCSPHDVFSASWGSYTLTDLGETFLPKLSNRKSSLLNLLDGASLFEQNSLQDQTSTFGFLGKSVLLSVMSYPKDASVAENKSKVSVKPNEVSVFMEVSQDETIDVFTYFGKDILSDAKSVGVDVDGSTQVKRTSIAELRRFVGNDISHAQFLFMIGSKDLSNTRPESLSPADIDRIWENLGVEFEAGEIRTDDNNAWAHGDIEFSALAAAGFKEWNIERIYYGNWLRDYSSIITPMAIGFSFEDIRTIKRSSTFDLRHVQRLVSSMNLKLTQSAWVKVIKVLAVKQFAYDRHKQVSENYYDYKEAFEKQFEHLTRDMLGLYQPEEHIDNPKGLVDERVFASSELNDPVISYYEDENGNKKKKKPYRGSNDELLKYANEYLGEPADYLKKYIKSEVPGYTSSFAFMAQELRLAVKHHWTAKGMRHLGAAFHVIEDYFAHTNFVELVLIKVGHTDVHPWVEVEDYINQIEDPKLKILDIPVVTGTFGFEDTIVSLGPQLERHLFPLKFNPSAKYEANDITFTDMIIEIVLNDFIRKEANVDPSKQTIIPGTGKTAQQLKIAFGVYKSFRSTLRAAKNTAKQIPVVGDVVMSYEQLSEKVLHSFLAYRNMLIRIFTQDFLKNHKHDVVSKKGYGSNPSHSQLAKDSASNPLNPLAGYLAFTSVKELGIEIKKIMNGPQADKQASTDALIQRIEDELFTHPYENDYFDEKVETWAKQHPTAVAKAEYKTITERFVDLIEYWAPEYYEDNEDIFQELIDRANEQN